MGWEVRNAAWSLKCYNLGMVSTQVQKTLEEKCAWDPDKTILLGLSGGPDSLCLLHVLRQLDAHVIAAHLDHGLRANSAMDSNQVAAICDAWGIPCFTLNADVISLARRKKYTIEEAARECRYRFLFEIARKQQAQAVIVAHNADDQVETILMHFLRGAGTSGLRGMLPSEINPSWSKTIPLWRPMLEVWRSEILDYCQAFSLNPILDESNQDPVFFRNRLRLSLIPELARYNSQIKQVLQRTGMVMAGDEALLKELTAANWDKVALTQASALIQLSREGFLNLALGLKRRILRQAIDQLRPGLRNISLEVIEKAISEIESPSNRGRISLAAKIDLQVSEETITLVDQDTALPAGDYPQLPQGDEGFLPIPGRLALKNEWSLHAELLDATQYASLKTSLWEDAGHSFLHGNRVQPPLEVRSKLPGDRFKPLGMQGHHQKISDLFVNKKIPMTARENWPLVLSHDEIIWVPGVMPGETLKLEGGEEKILHLYLERAPSNP